MRLSAFLSALAVATASSRLAFGEPPARPTPPVVETAEVTYPEGGDGRSAVVVLLLVVDAEGRVTDAKVEKEGVPAFDAAAVRAASSFRFKPAQKDGARVAARIRFEVRFEPAKKAAPPPPAPPPSAPVPDTSAPPPGTPKEPDEITVTDKKATRAAPQQTLAREELRTTAGAGGDPLRAAAQVPGIQRTPAFQDLLILRGSSPGSSAVFYDGIFLPRATHFGGLSSVVPLEMLDRIDVFPGNFPARYGRLDGGVIELGGRKPSPDGKLHAVAQVDTLDGRAYIEAPVGRGFTLTVGARRSWLDAWLGKVLDDRAVGAKTAPYYYDGQIIAETSPSATSRLRFGILGAYDAFRLVARAPLGDEPAFGGSFDNRSGFVRGFVIHEARPLAGVKTHLSLSAGPDFERQRLGGLLADSRIDMLAGRAEATIEASPDVDVRAGLDLLGAAYVATIRVPTIHAEGGYDPPPISSQRFVTFDGSGTLVRPGAFFETEWRPHRRVALVHALRIDHTREFQDTTVSPRFNGKVVLHDGPHPTTLRAGLGLFHMAPPIQAVVPALGTKDLTSSATVHAALGVEQSLGRGTSLSVEGYSKWMESMPSHDPNRGPVALNANDAKGRAYGVEVVAKVRPGGRFSGTATYVLSRAERTDQKGGTSRLFEFDQTHQLALYGQASLGRGYSLGTRFRASTGIPYTPCQAGMLSSDSGAYGCVSGAPFSERLPTFVQWDLRFEKRWERPTWTFSAYADIQNVTNRENAETVTYAYDKSTKRFDGGLGLFPILGVRGEL